MPRRSVSLKQAQRTYDDLRARFFMDVKPPLLIPPPASRLEWGWLPDNSDAVAETTFDGNEPVALRLNEKLCRWSVITRETLLHELTHMRLGVKPSCGGFSHAWRGGRVTRSMHWHRETVRLAQAGALKL